MNKKKYSQSIVCVVELLSGSEVNPLVIVERGIDVALWRSSVDPSNIALQGSVCIQPTMCRG